MGLASREDKQEEKSGKKETEQGEEDIRGQPPSYTASHRERSKEKYTEVIKLKAQREKEFRVT